MPLKPLRTRYYSLAMQCFISVLLVMVISLICYYTYTFIGGYRVVALLLLVVVSFIAMVFEILPVLLAAIVSAVTWNFFFIPPVFTFHISNAEDGLMFSLYFIIALVNAVLTIKIRKTESKLRDKEEKENTIKLYNTLLNSLSHELRTPISTIIGAVDTLQENREKLTIGQQTELLLQVEEAGVRLNRQVENLLNMSRLESGILKLNVDWCDMNELINSVIRKNTLNSKRTVEFIPDDKLPLFKVDEGLVEQALFNIIHNALQYTPEQAKVKIWVSHMDNNCVIKIWDNGPGIPNEDLPYIFEKFYRVPNSKTGGSGLGLSIAKGFIEAHNGRIKLENNSSKGVNFTIHIPAESSYINSLKNE